MVQLADVDWTVAATITSAIAGAVSAVAALFATYYAARAVQLANLPPALAIEFREEPGAGDGLWSLNCRDIGLEGAHAEVPYRRVIARVCNTGTGPAKGTIAVLQIVTDQPAEFFVPSADGNACVHPGGGILDYPLIDFCGTKKMMRYRSGGREFTSLLPAYGQPHQLKLKLRVTSETGSAQLAEHSAFLTPTVLESQP